MIDDELCRIGNSHKKDVVNAIMQISREYVVIDNEIKKRTYVLKSMGFHSADAIHIACAERAQSIFLTTDKQILQIAKRNSQLLNTPIAHPVIWLEGGVNGD